MLMHYIISLKQTYTRGPGLIYFNHMITTALSHTFGSAATAAAALLLFFLFLNLLRLLRIASPAQPDIGIGVEIGHAAYIQSPARVLL